MKDESLPPHGTAVDKHPRPETLLAYRDDELSADDDERVREHLAGCADCTGLVLDLTTEDGADGEAGELSELDVERAWRRTRPRLAGPARHAGPALPWPMLLAASLLLASVPLLFFRYGDDRMSAVRLPPLDAARSPGAQGPCTTLAGDGDVWLLSLPVRGDVLDDPTATPPRLEILTDERQLVATRELTVDSTEGFQVELRGADLTAGRYLLYLVDPRPAEPELIERYCVEIPGD